MIKGDNILQGRQSGTLSFDLLELQKNGLYPGAPGYKK